MIRMGEKKRPRLVTFGMPWWLAAGLALVVIVSAWTGALTTDMTGCLALMLAIGFLCNEVGERIPIWNSYVGGGLVLAFLVSAILFTYKIIPQEYAESMQFLVLDVNFLSFFIIFLVTGSILSLDRRLLLRSFARYLPTIFGGIVGASLFGIFAGMLYGVTPMDVMVRYVLPIMGGGNGAGAVPLSQIYKSATGQSASGYYSFALTILTIANVFAIFMGALLNHLGKRLPEWTGDGKTLLRSGNGYVKEEKKSGVSARDLGGAFFLTLGFCALGRLFANVIVPNIFGVAIHPLAYMVVFVVLAAALGIVPENICVAVKRLQAFFGGNLVLVIMVGIGSDTNFLEMLEFLTVRNVVIAIAIVLGATIGSAIVGQIVGFFPIDAAITAGLCMANRGGAGDLAVLGASKRMGLMAYAQFSSRFGGAIVLIIGSVLFGKWLG